MMTRPQPEKEPVDRWIQLETRRQFFRRSSAGLGSVALASMMQQDARAEGKLLPPGVGDLPAKAKRVIYLFMAGAPSQLDFFDYKPEMEKRFDQDLPESIRGNQRLTAMTSAQPRLPIAPSIFEFQKYGESGHWVSELLPHTATITDDLSYIHSMWTEAINHDPAITYIQTGNQIPGKPSLGAWVSYGLGSMNRNLPDFIVLNCEPRGQPLYSRLWGSGFLPSNHAGVAFRAQGDPVLYLSNPSGISSDLRRAMLNKLDSMNERIYQDLGDPETQSRISQYEMAFRMQSSVPQLVDISNEPKSVLESYGPEVETPGSFAYNCLLARRMMERDVRFVQVFHRGWDHHIFLPMRIRSMSKEIDQPCKALITDLKERGLLDDTLVVWGGEFGRTIYSQGSLTKDDYGRDHHPRCFTTWLAGGGIKPGMSYGATDEFGYNIVENPVHIRDLNATILHQLGIDHERFSVKHLGLNQRLTGVQEAHVVKELLG